MKHAIVKAIAISLVSITFSACDKLIEPKDKGLIEIDAIRKRWQGGVSLAESTPKIALSSQVANLQSINRDLDGVVVSECLKEAKVALSRYMEYSIQGFIEFMGDRNRAASENLERANSAFDSYRQERIKCTK